MKKIKKEITKTNLDKIKAFKLINKNDSIAAKDCVNETFKLNGYAMYNACITDDDTGETTVYHNVVLDTTIGTIGTNSQSLVSSLTEMLDYLGDEIYNLDLMITKGKSASGNTFVDIEIA